MGLDVTAVETKHTYLRVTRFPVDAFVLDLASGPIGMGADLDDIDYWGGGWESNGEYEYSQDGLKQIASAWATSRKISTNERRRLRRWVSNLPYKDGHIMLHFSW